MTMTFFKKIAIGAYLLTFTPVFAQEIPKAEDSPKGHIDQVKISALRDPELRSYSQLLKGLKVYSEKLDLAPNSELFFILIPKSGVSNLHDLKMRLASDETSIAIPVDSTGQFKLPFIETTNDDEYDLILSIPKGQFLIRPYVKSANLQPNTKRMGDFRLECQVRWAIEKQDVSTVFSIYVKLLASGSPCSSRTVDVGFYAPNGVDSVFLDTENLKLSHKVNSYERFSLPLWNKEINDNDLVRFTSSKVGMPSN